MTTTKKNRKTTSESIVREIKRRTRRKFTAEEKIRIVLDGLRGEASITDLCRTMKAEDVKETLDMAIEQTGVEHVQVVQRPRLLSDNGPCYISRELKSYLEKQDIRHIRTKVYHPMTQGKIERYHRSMKNLILLDHYYSPTELTERIREWVDYYNNDRYHEAIDNVTPADKYYGRDVDVLKNREKVRKQTMKLRRKLNRMAVLQTLPNGVS